MGYSPWDPKESDTTEQLSTTQHKAIDRVILHENMKTVLILYSEFLKLVKA